MLTTTTDVLARLHRDDSATWETFDDRWRDIVERFAARLGLDPEAAAECAQDTIVAVHRGLRDRRYERTRGRMRAWIFGIARHCAQRQRRRPGARGRRGDSAIVHRASPDVAATWDDVWERSVLRESLARLRRDTRIAPRTRAAFEAVVIRGDRPDVVATTLGMTVNDVYLAKHRCLRRLRAIAARVARSLDAGAEGDAP
ncbi:MAG: sigma-70 family RNA polymerase sigma factor [Phycisphaerales bacterium]|nr:sigma-70 family RNA polymerase sigma factor [Phycisphaerales bacterium]